MDFGRESQDNVAAEQLIYDYRKAPLSEVDRALCDYAVKLTLNPQAMSKTDIETLQQLQLSDEAITIATQVIGYFNYINRIADGLGVDLETWMDRPIEKWISEKADFRSLG